MIYNSYPVYATRLPTPKLTEGRFIYNYFEKNEREIDAISSRFDFNKSQKTNTNTYSREIKISWTNEGANDFEKLEPQKDEEFNSLINENLNSNYTYLNLQDLNIVNTIEFKAKKTIQEYYDLGLISDKSPITKEVIDSIIKNEHNFLNYIPNSRFDQLTSNTFSTSVKNSELKPLIANLEYNLHSQYQNSFKDIATEAIDSNYQQTYAEPSANKSIQKKLIGFYVDKYKINNGNFDFYKTIFVKSSKTHYYDRQVSYDQSYAYTIKNIFKVTLKSLEPDLKTISYFDYYLTSTPSNFVVVSCTENVAPPPPVDLTFSWVRENKKLNIRWRMPTNSQRDIKGFLIFKRESLNESYRLLKMYDFNDATPRLPLPYELIKTGKIEYVTDKVNGDIVPKFTFDDYDFKPGSTAIYAIACYDAHGLYSNLSSQIKINLKVSDNMPTKELVSRIGAPISYPNLLLEQDLFLDSLVIDGYTNMKIYFDPDCDKILQVENTFNNNEVSDQMVYESGTEDDNHGYQFTFLNVATQQFEKHKLKLIVK